jgi:hypothetical protein
MGGKWFPFTARQLVSAVPSSPGFVWEANINLIHQKVPWTTLHVCDAWSAGQGHLEAAALGGALTLATMNDADPILIEGEALRWLAEAVWIPTALRSGLVTWTAIPDQPYEARLSIVDPYNHGDATKPFTSLVATFDQDTSFITKIKALRPKLEGKDKYILSPWSGFFSNFSAFGEGLVVWAPTHGEVGWGLEEDNTLEMYYKGDCLQMEYEWQTPKNEAMTTE